MGDDLHPDTHATCTGPHCGAPIVWVLTEGGKRMPLEPEPSPGGNVTLTRDDRGRIRARVLAGDQLPAQQEAWTPHHQVCPDAADFRRRQKALTPRCRRCDQPMDHWLVEHGYDSHIGCLPPTRAEIDQMRTHAKERSTA